MMLARVDGTLIATRKHPSFNGWRLLICQPMSAAGEPEGTPVVAIDPLGAARLQYVVVSTDGSAARLAVKDPKSPARMMIIGIVDEVNAAVEDSRGSSGLTPFAAIPAGGERRLRRI
jgi:microcompartment protein CcmK/EutM